MDQTGIYVNFGVNGLHFTRAMFDNGCHSYMAISDRLQRKLQLPTLLIRPRTLEQVAGVDYNAINRVSFFDIDIDGHRQRRVWAYIIPQMQQDVILGLPWARSQEVTIRHSDYGDSLHIGTTDTYVTLRKDPTWTTDNSTKVVSAAVFSALARRNYRKQKRVNIFAVTMADIEKALDKLNKKKKPTDPKTKLPAYYHDKIDMRIFTPE
ncbi:Pol protein [Pyrenophora tritici-repentis]|nr:Pol protein [Pyrenophora tritici-repentis]KAF7441709.1 Pol protein [Pyrenophora tritici-repentis]KAF7441757.1 Pol protein [Pyrenophora tritici-repentis]